jgi:hypothetical protein
MGLASAGQTGIIAEALHTLSWDMAAFAGSGGGGGPADKLAPPLLLKIQGAMDKSKLAASPIIMYDESRSFCAETHAAAAGDIVELLRKAPVSKIFLFASRGTKDGVDGIFVRTDATTDLMPTW